MGVDSCIKESIGVGFGTFITSELTVVPQRRKLQRIGGELLQQTSSNGGSCRGRRESWQSARRKSRGRGRKGVTVAEEALNGAGKEVCDGDGASASSDANGALQEALNSYFSL
ncbi:hypothetical protein U1Q18_028367 [Sarracenia purpurea var. burkii]